MRFEDPNHAGTFYDATLDKDGNPVSMTGSNGDVIEWKDGAIYKNGELFKEQKVEEIIDADGDGMPEMVNLTDKGTPVPFENIGGAYTNSGNSYYYGVSSDWKDVWLEAPAETVIEVNVTGENTFNILNTATGKNSPVDLTYDPATGRAHGEYTTPCGNGKADERRRSDRACFGNCTAGSGPGYGARHHRRRVPRGLCFDSALRLYAKRSQRTLQKSPGR